MNQLISNFNSKNIYRQLIIIFCLMGIMSTSAQTFTFADVAIIKNGKRLVNALDGGMNSPQFSQFDIDGDGNLEIILFDKVGDVFSVYRLNTSTNEYEFWQDPPVVFPLVNDMALIRDYNGDGIMDMFAIPTDDIIGFAVWKGVKKGAVTMLERVQLNKWYFNVLSYPGNNGRLNVYTTSIDIPDIQDIDGDGDLDIFSFNEEGSHMVFYKNNSVELGFGKDSLLYTLEDYCYGKFLEGGLNNDITLSPDPNKCARNFDGEDPIELRHSGSTILIKDIDHDGKRDILLGDVSFNNVVYLRNTGSNTKAHVTEEVRRFPDGDEAVDLGPFPSVYALELGQEKSECIVATSNAGLIEAERQLNWLYLLDTTRENNFRLVQKDFIINNSFDMGLENNPAILDVDADGRPDLVIGNKFFKEKDNSQYGQLVYLRNISEDGKLSFEIMDEDFAGLKSFGIKHFGFKPTFTDIDHNGFMDMLVGTEKGTLLHYESKNPIGQPIEFELKSESYQNIKVPSRAAPEALDFDGDGDIDLIIGDKNGNFCLFVNTGSATQPIFTPSFQDAPNVYPFGKVSVKEVGNTEGDACPSIIKLNGKNILVSGSYSGKIFAYEGLEQGSNTTLSPVSINSGNIYTGRQNNPVFGDLDGDGLLEMIQGNIRGGFTIMRTNITTEGNLSVNNSGVKETIRIFPNPINSGSLLYVKNYKEITQADVFSLTGKLVETYKEIHKNGAISLPIGLEPGIYVLRIRLKNSQVFSEKIIVVD